MPARRSKRARKRSRTRTRSRRRRAAPTPIPSAIGEAEARLLALARELAAPPLDADPAAALHFLAAAHAPDAPLPRAIARAWIEGREDKTTALRLAWAREQVRLTLEEILARARPRGALAGDVATRAWLLLAGAESIAQEPAAAGADRLKTLVALTLG